MRAMIEAFGSVKAGVGDMASAVKQPIEAPAAGPSRG